MKAKLIKGKEHYSLQMNDKDILALGLKTATIGINKDTSIVASTWKMWKGTLIATNDPQLCLVAYYEATQYQFSNNF